MGHSPLVRIGEYMKMITLVKIVLAIVFTALLIGAVSKVHAEKKQVEFTVVYSSFDSVNLVSYIKLLDANSHLSYLASNSCYFHCVIGVVGAKVTGMINNNSDIVITQEDNGKQRKYNFRVITINSE